MRLFVTGGLGTIGSMVTRHLVESGHEVTVLDIKPTETALVQDLTGRFTLIGGDISDSLSLIEAIRVANPDVVIHMAALLDVQGVIHPSRHIATNISGFMNVMEACRLLRVRRLVFASSRAVYLDLRPDADPAFGGIPSITKR